MHYNDSTSRTPRDVQPTVHHKATLCMSSCPLCAAPVKWRWSGIEKRAANERDHAEINPSLTDL